MKRIKIKIVLIGIPSTKIDCKNLSRWNSILFKIDSEPLLLSNLSDINFDGLNLSNEIIIDLFNRRVNSDNNDLIVGITDRILDGNWFTQRISENSFVISLHEFEEKLRLNNIPLENFILRFIYPFGLIYLNNKNKIPEHENTLIHKDSQRCIFDFMKYKSDVMDTLIKPIISIESKSKFTVALPEKFLQKIEKELQRLNIRLFYRIKKWIIKRPILTIFISGLFAIILNLIASIIYGLYCK
jgi:hypothetical protein